MPKGEKSKWRILNRKLSEKQINQAKDLLQRGYGIKDLSERFGVSHSYFQYHGIYKFKAFN